MVEFRDPVSERYGRTMTPPKTDPHAPFDPNNVGQFKYARELMEGLKKAGATITIGSDGLVTVVGEARLSVTVIGLMHLAHYCRAILDGKDPADRIEGDRTIREWTF